MSAATVWEIAIKRALGRLESPPALVSALDRLGFDALAVTASHGELAAALPPVHGDPFDRMLVAQAQLEGLTIVTRDAAIARYQVAVLAA